MRRLLLAAVTAAALAGCWIGGPTNGANGGGNDGGGVTGEGGAGDGLPCDVANVLATYCASCHGSSSPSSGTPLMAYADLAAKSKTDPSKTEAEVSLARMKDGTMPPSGNKPTATEIAAFEAWVTGGMQQGTCAANDPFSGPHVCTSGQKYAGGEGYSMEPGNACVACHTSEPGSPKFTIAGTVYPTGHEPARCFGSGAKGAVVIITDKNGKQTSYTVNSAGNFAGSATIALPYTAEVQYMGKTRAMVAPQTSGDCNTCHTENGANGAPGRIALP